MTNITRNVNANTHGRKISSVVQQNKIISKRASAGGAYPLSTRTDQEHKLRTFLSTSFGVETNLSVCPLCYDQNVILYRSMIYG
mmetsp:Transcript_28985/g.60297  ORF Transcript_28985/g.60297 Transcript_28985/m.60297 type:complete len:84 (-) Transcript_28985:50-301(-)